RRDGDWGKRGRRCTSFLPIGRGDRVSNTGNVAEAANQTGAMMQVLHVCSEMFPLLKTGGLADVLGALPAAQIAGGVDTRVLLPAFPDIRRGIPDAKVVTRRETFAGRITLLFGHYYGG